MNCSIAWGNASCGEIVGEWRFAEVDQDLRVLPYRMLHDAQCRRSVVFKHACQHHQ